MTLARELTKAHSELQVAETAVHGLEDKVTRLRQDIIDLQVDLDEAGRNLAAWRERLAVRQAEWRRLSEEGS